GRDGPTLIRLMTTDASAAVAAEVLEKGIASIQRAIAAERLRGPGGIGKLLHIGDTRASRCELNRGQQGTQGESGKIGFHVQLESKFRKLHTQKTPNASVQRILKSYHNYSAGQAALGRKYQR